MAESGNVIPDSNGLLLSSKEYSKFCDETNLFFFNKLDNIKDIIQCRGDAFSQKKEKYKHLKDFQLSKMEKEREQYLKKMEELSTKIEQSKSQLDQLQCTISELRVKHSNQRQVNEVLKEQFKALQLNTKQKDEHFKKTLSNYTTVINWYEYFLNISIDLENENHKIVSVKLNNNCKNETQVVVEILNDNNFKILKIQPFFEDETVTDRIISKPELMSLLYKIQKSANG